MCLFALQIYPMQNQTRPSQRSYWLQTLLEWHWISSALCLVGLLLFTLTGITLNHAHQIEAKPQTTLQQDQLPATLLGNLQAQVAAHAPGNFSTPLPLNLQTWITENWQLKTATYLAEWSAEEIYLAMPRPGGDAWLRLDLQSGEIEYSLTQRGWISYLNDLHKGRNTGKTWSWFIDIFAAACLVFCITGLFIMKMHAKNRPITWPILAAGLVLPALLILLFMH